MSPLIKKSVAAVAVVVSVLMMPAQAEAAQIVVKMASVVPAGSEWHNALLQMGEDWKKASGGQVILRIYPGQTMGDDSDVIRKMKLGSLQSALLAGVSEIDPSVLALQVPMMYSNYEEVDYVQQRLQQRIESAMAAKGFVVLNWTEGGWVHFFTKQPVRTPQDLQKLKLFAWAGDTDVIETYRSLGFNPVPLPSTEISTALQTGLITALPAPPQAAAILQWYNHAKNMTDVKWALLIGATVINKKTWDSIPAEMRPALLQAARTAGQRLRDITRRNTARDIEAMKKRGLNVVHVDAALEAQWRKAAENAYPRVRGTVIPADIFDEARRQLADYRKQKSGS